MVMFTACMIRPLICIDLHTIYIYQDRYIYGLTQTTLYSSLHML